MCLNNPTCYANAKNASGKRTMERKINLIILYPINSSNRPSSYVPRDRPIYSGIGSKKSVFFPYWTVEYKCTKQLFYNDKSRYREKVSECTIIDSHACLS